MHSKTCVLYEKRFEINRFPIEFVCHIIYYYYYLKQFIEKISMHRDQYLANVFFKNEKLNEL